MRGRFLTVVVLIFLLPMLLPSTIAQQEQPEWRSIGIDPETKQRVSKSKINVDPRIRVELATILTQIATAWSVTENKFATQTTGKQFYLTSGYRDPIRNVNAKSTAVNHRTGKAVDLSIKGWDESAILEFIDLCFEKGITNIGTADNFLHLDILGRETGNWKRAWNYNGEEAAKYATKALPIYIKYGVKHISLGESQYEQWDSPLASGWVETIPMKDKKPPSGERKIASIISPYNVTINT